MSSSILACTAPRWTGDTSINLVIIYWATFCTPAGNSSVFFGLLSRSALLSMSSMLGPLCLVGVTMTVSADTVEALFLLICLLLSSDAAERPDSSSLLVSCTVWTSWCCGVAKVSLGCVLSWAIWPLRNAQVVMILSSLVVLFRRADPLFDSFFSILPKSVLLASKHFLTCRYEQSLKVAASSFQSFSLALGLHHSLSRLSNSVGCSLTNSAICLISSSVNL